MDVEHRALLQAVGGERGTMSGHNIVISKSGIGKVNAALATQNIISAHHPQAIISTGLAGGIDNVLHVSDIIAASHTVYHDVWCGSGNHWGQVQGLPAQFEADQQLLQTAVKTAKNTSLPMHCGLVCTGDQFITDRDALNKIKENFPNALACDMESAAIAQTCYIHSTPFLSLRVVSDTPGNTDNHARQWDEFLASLCGASFQFVSKFIASL